MLRILRLTSSCRWLVKSLWSYLLLDSRAVCSENKKYVLNVRINCLKPNQQWWYHACAVCNRHAIPEGNIYGCSVRKCTSTRGSPRYRFTFVAIDPTSLLQDDSTPSIELAFFGPKAEELLGTPVHNLIAAQSVIGSFLPNKITDLYGKEFQVRISLSPSSLDRKDISFQVNSVIASSTVNTVPEGHVMVPSNLQGNEYSASPNIETITRHPQAFSHPTQHQEQEHVLCSEQEVYEDKGHNKNDTSKYMNYIFHIFIVHQNIALSQNITCTPPPQTALASIEPKTYKRSREEDDSNVIASEKSMPIACLGRERGRASKRLKFETSLPEK